MFVDDVPRAQKKARTNRHQGRYNSHARTYAVMTRLTKFARNTLIRSSAQHVTPSLPSYEPERQILRCTSRAEVLHEVSVSSSTPGERFTRSHASTARLEQGDAKVGQQGTVVRGNDMKKGSAIPSSRPPKSDCGREYHGFNGYRVRRITASPPRLPRLPIVHSQVSEGAIRNFVQVVQRERQGRHPENQAYNNVVPLLRQQHCMNEKDEKAPLLVADMRPGRRSSTRGANELYTGAVVRLMPFIPRCSRPPLVRHC